MSTFEYLQRKSSTGSTPAPLTSHLLRSSRPHAPAPVSAPEQASADPQTQPAHGTLLKYSLDGIPVFPPAKKNDTGIPDTSKAGVESYSGMAMDAESTDNNSLVIHQRIPFSATIQRVDAGSSTKNRLDNQQPFHPSGVPVAHLDARSDKDSRVGGSPPEAKRNQPRTNIPEPEEGQTVHLPDITYPGLPGLSQADAVSSAFVYNGTVTQIDEEPPAGAFGYTGYEHSEMKNRTVMREHSRYHVHATLDCQMTFQVRKTTGPQGQLDISSPESIYITNSNYEEIAKDLTPDMRVLGGCPPRHNYWAKDITVIHERFHADEGIKLFFEGLSVAQRTFDKQNFSSANEVHKALDMVPVIAVDYVGKRSTFPGNEERAYGDSAHLYTDRVKAILSKGKAGEYPGRPDPHPIKKKDKTGGSVSPAKSAE